MSSIHKNLSDFSHIQVGSAAGLQFIIVVSQWNAEITGALLNGALETLGKYGADPSKIRIIEVPGSYELISGADLAMARHAAHAVICLGCVIQGETRHFDFISQAVATGLANVSLKHGKPVIFGVLTTDTSEQARERAGGRHGNKGAEAAVTAIQMANLD